MLINANISISRFVLSSALQFRKFTDMELAVQRTDIPLSSFLRKLKTELFSRAFSFITLKDSNCRPTLNAGEHKHHRTRLHQFARSLLYNATAGGALWWLRKSHIVNYANHQHSPFARRRHDVSNYIPPPLSFGESFMKIRSAVPENGCLIVLVDGKKNKKNKKTTAKHVRIHLLPEGGCVNYHDHHQSPSQLH